MTASTSAATTPATTIVDAEVDGRVVDVRIANDRIVAVEASLPRGGTRVVQAGRGALIAGLHDHHLHLLAMAAWDRSVDVSGSADAAGFDDAVAGAHAARPGAAEWMRVVGYREAHGPLDLDRLEAVAPARPLRVQHRSGAAWFLNRVAARRLGLEPRDGWWFRPDEQLGAGWSHDDGDRHRLDLGAVSRRLAAYGITGVTDATPFGSADGFDLLAAARRRGDLAQHVTVMGGTALAHAAAPPELALGPVKVIVRDDEPCSPDALADAIRTAHRAGRPVAVHCVSRVATVLALAAWQRSGARPGDRIEHGSVLPIELLSTVAELGLTVVSQPGFIAARGDDYLAAVDDDDLAELYRCASLLDAGIGLGASTDAPFGPDDPWLTIRTARDRATPSGAVLGAGETITTRRALDAFLSHPADPGGTPRQVEPGATADLCLLDAPLATALEDPARTRVVTTWIAGRVAHQAM